MISSGGGYADGPPHNQGIYAFWQNVILPNGRVVICPFNSRNVGLYDPLTREYTNGPRHNLTGIASPSAAHGVYCGAILLADGRVLFTPWDAPFTGVYDPVADTLINVPSDSGVGSRGGAYWGGCQIADGRVVLASCLSAMLGLFDPATNTFTQGPSHGRGISNAAFCDAVALPNGLVLLVPYWGGNPRRLALYNPATNTVINGPAHDQGDPLGPQGAFSRGVLMYDGRVLLVPFHRNFGLYTPDPGGGIGSYANGPAVIEGNWAFSQAVLLADGTYLMVPEESNHIGFFNPANDTYTRGPRHGWGSEAFSDGGHLLTDPPWWPYERVLLTPFNSFHLGFWDTVIHDASAQVY